MVPLTAPRPSPAPHPEGASLAEVEACLEQASPPPPTCARWPMCAVGAGRRCCPRPCCGRACWSGCCAGEPTYPACGGCWPCTGSGRRPACRCPHKPSPSGWCTEGSHRNLPDGNYVMLCFESGEDGAPHTARGMVKTFTVAGPAVAAAAPSAGANVELRDFSFTVPEFKQGETWVKLTNTCQQDHEMAVVRLNDGVSPEDALKWDPSAGTPPPFQLSGGLPPMASNMTQFVKLDLQAGSYLMVCFITDPASGQPHMALGMSASFTVE